MALQTPPESGFDIPISTTADMANQGTLLPVDYISQGQTRNLCWAACCEMVLRANGVLDKKICEIAQLFVDPSINCCADPNVCPEDCDKTLATPEQAYASCNVMLSDANSPYQSYFEMSSLVSEIGKNHRPVEIYFLWNGGASAHLALAIGVKSAASGTNSMGMVYMNDPLYGYGWVAYEDVLAAYGYGGTWRQTWQGIGYSLGPLT